MRITITGIDTEVGKSVVTACLAAGLRAAGRTPSALKPVASGVPDGSPGEDAALLARGAGHEPRISLTFRPPVSPHRAQLDAGRDVDVDGLLAWIDDHSGPVTLVEGAGGWRVPLLVRSDGRFFEVVDLARHVGGPVLIVAANRLGVLNHTRLTVEAIRADGLQVLGVVLNEVTSPVDDASRASNLADLRALLDVPVIPFGRVDLADEGAMAEAGRALVETLGLG